MKVSNVTIKFGGITALERVSFDIRKGMILGLIGPNGAGKTTLFNCISRLYDTLEGNIFFEGKSILRLPTYKICEVGIGRTFQNLALFKSMSVLENVMVGGHHHTKSDFISNTLKLPWARQEDRLLREEAMELLRYFNLSEVAHASVSTLPFGTQKRVELARALATRPKLLLLDEPAGGLNHFEISQLIDLIRQIQIEKKSYHFARRASHAIRDEYFRPSRSAQFWSKKSRTTPRKPFKRTRG